MVNAYKTVFDVFNLVSITVCCCTVSSYCVNSQCDAHSSYKRSIFGFMVELVPLDKEEKSFQVSE